MRITRPAAPVLLTNIVKELREVDGVIWSTDRQEAGTLLRVTISQKNVRILVPALGKRLPISTAYEKGCPLHVVVNMESLRSWLQNLIPVNHPADLDFSTKKG